MLIVGFSFLRLFVLDALPQRKNYDITYFKIKFFNLIRKDWIIAL